MRDFDLLAEAIALPSWVVAAAAVAILFFAAFTVARVGWRLSTTIFARLAAIFVAITLVWAFADRMAGRERAEERRALEARMTALTARAVMPGSPLACLDAIAAENVIEACEKALFANPETVAAALSYVGARLTLLADIAEFARAGGNPTQALAELRRSAERDRFGFVAQVLATGHNCTVENCPTLSLLSDPAWVSANLRERTFDVHVARYATSWASSKSSVVAPLVSDNAATSQASTGHASRSNFTFPSATSIPPVSIMNNEPGATGQNGVDSAKTEAKPGGAARDAKTDAKAPTGKRANNKPERAQTADTPREANSPAAIPETPARN